MSLQSFLNRKITDNFIAQHMRVDTLKYQVGGLPLFEHFFHF